VSFLSKARYIEQNTPPDSPVRHHVTTIERLAEHLAGGLRLEMTQGRPVVGQDEGEALSIEGVRLVARVPDADCLLVSFIHPAAFEAAKAATLWLVGRRPLTLEARLVDNAIGVPATGLWFAGWALVVPGAEEIWT
jgi:hypothetical protein